MINALPSGKPLPDERVVAISDFGPGVVPNPALGNRSSLVAKGRVIPGVLFTEVPSPRRMQSYVHASVMPPDPVAIGSWQGREGAGARGSPTRNP